MTTRPETVPGIARISRKNARTGRAPFIVVIMNPRALQLWSAVSCLCDSGYPGLAGKTRATVSQLQAVVRSSAAQSGSERKNLAIAGRSRSTRACVRFVFAADWFGLLYGRYAPDSQQVLQRSEMTRCAIC